MRRERRTIEQQTITIDQGGVLHAAVLAAFSSSAAASLRRERKFSVLLTQSLAVLLVKLGVMAAASMKTRWCFIMKFLALALAAVS